MKEAIPTGTSGERVCGSESPRPGARYRIGAFGLDRASIERDVSSTTKASASRPHLAVDVHSSRGCAAASPSSTAVDEQVLRPAGAAAERDGSGSPMAWRTSSPDAAEPQAARGSATARASSAPSGRQQREVIHHASSRCRARRRRRRARRGRRAAGSCPRRPPSAGGPAPRRSISWRLYFASSLSGSSAIACSKLAIALSSSSERSCALRPTGGVPGGDADHAEESHRARAAASGRVVARRSTRAVRPWRSGAARDSGRRRSRRRRLLSAQSPGACGGTRGRPRSPSTRFPAPNGASSCRAARASGRRRHAKADVVCRQAVAQARHVDGERGARNTAGRAGSRRDDEQQLASAGAALHAAVPPAVGSAGGPHSARGPRARRGTAAPSRSEQSSATAAAGRRAARARGPARRRAA